VDSGFPSSARAGGRPPKPPARRRTGATRESRQSPNPDNRQIASASAAVSTSDFRLPPSAFRLPPSAFRLPPSAFRLPPSGFRLLGAKLRPPTTVEDMPNRLANSASPYLLQHADNP